MPVVDLLVDSVLGNKVISFLDGKEGYNQIFMVKEDVSKTAFRCSGFIGLFEWVVMTFRMKNADATYQRAMNLIFHDLLRVLMEVYIDDMVVISVGFEEHITNLKIAVGKNEEVWTTDEPIEVRLQSNIGKVLGVCSA
jgi:hypothetical protein